MIGEVVRNENDELVPRTLAGADFGNICKVGYENDVDRAVVITDNNTGDGFVGISCGDHNVTFNPTTGALKTNCIAAENGNTVLPLDACTTLVCKNLAVVCCITGANDEFTNYRYYNSLEFCGSNTSLNDTVIQLDYGGIVGAPHTYIYMDLDKSTCHQYCEITSGSAGVYRVLFGGCTQDGLTCNSSPIYVHGILDQYGCPNGLLYDARNGVLYSNCFRGKFSGSIETAENICTQMTTASCTKYLTFGDLVGDSASIQDGCTALCESRYLTFSPSSGLLNTQCLSINTGILRVGGTTLCSYTGNGCKILCVSGDNYYLGCTNTITGTTSPLGLIGNQNTITNTGTYTNVFGTFNCITGNSNLISVYGTRLCVENTGDTAVFGRCTCTCNIAQSAIFGYCNNIKACCCSNTVQNTVIGTFNTFATGSTIGYKTVVGSSNCICTTGSSNATVVGYRNCLGNGNGLIVGNYTCSSSAAAAVGTYSRATNTLANVFGYCSVASGVRSIAIGSNVCAQGPWDIVIGNCNATTGESYSIVIGNNNTCCMNGNTKIVIGYNNGSCKHWGNHIVAVGPYTCMAGQCSVAIGPFASIGTNSNNADYGVAVGSCTLAGRLQATAVGHNARAVGCWSTALGYGTCAQGDSSIAIGDCAATTIGTNNISIGQHINDDCYNCCGAYNTFIGHNIQTVNSSYNLVIGANAGIVNTSFNVLLGYGTTSGGCASVVVGVNSHSCACYGVIVGPDATVTAHHGIAIGQNSNVSGVNGVAIGCGAGVSKRYDLAINSTTHDGLVRASIRKGDWMEVTIHYYCNTPVCDIYNAIAARIALNSHNTTWYTSIGGGAGWPYVTACINAAGTIIWARDESNSVNLAICAGDTRTVANATGNGHCLVLSCYDGSCGGWITMCGPVWN